ncbi:MAG: hypothetical protein M5R38_12295 [Candidatus Methylomirabilis sp.]|nr:hypothetical protein [Candidatus Methylomirabilis sp.]
MPTLVGTILVDHERKAILNDRGKANIYAIGQEVAGGTISEIREDRIIYKRGDTAREIILKAAIEPAAPASPAVKAPEPVVNRVEGSERPDRAEIQRRRQERLERRQRRSVE